MNLAEKLLQKLSEWQPGEGRHSLTVSEEDAGWAVTLTADRSDALGCLLWEMTLRRRGETPAADAGALQSWADNVAQRVTGLLEPLKVVEVDPLRNQALLRSQEPSRRGDDLFYYELLLTGTNEAGIRRYKAGQFGGPRREQIAFALTRDSLAKFTEDVIAAR